GKLVDGPERPFVVVLGGGRASNKPAVIESLLTKADTIVVGGAMAYTFIKSLGGEVGDSLVEDDMLATAVDIMRRAKSRGVDLLLPSDSVCAERLEQGVETALHPSNAIPAGLKGLDI